VVHILLPIAAGFHRKPPPGYFTEV